jgi:hypothetical protein
MPDRIRGPTEPPTTKEGQRGMEWMIGLGALVSFAGIAGLIWCVLLALQARKTAADEDDMRNRLQRVVILNMAALGVSALGLMIVVSGILLS